MKHASTVEHMFCDLDLCHGRGFHPSLSLLPPIDADIDKLDGLSDLVAKAILVPDAVGEICVGVQLFYVVWSVPSYGRDVTVVRQGCRVDPNFA